MEGQSTNATHRPTRIWLTCITTTKSTGNNDFSCARACAPQGDGVVSGASIVQSGVCSWGRS